MPGWPAPALAIRFVLARITRKVKGNWQRSGRAADLVGKGLIVLQPVRLITYEKVAGAFRLELLSMDAEGLI